MLKVLIIFHVIISLSLIVVVILQTGKGSDIGATFGAGASDTLFGSTGPVTFLNKLTIILAILFVTTSLLIGNSVMKKRNIFKKGSIVEKRVK